MNQSEQIKEEARKLGFLDCGIVPAEYLKEDAARLKKWIDAGFHSGMQYMEGYFEKRTNPGLLVEDAKSVIVVLQNYHTQAGQSDSEAPVLSTYAYGRDYHKVVKKKLLSMLDAVRKITGSASGRAFVDSAPVLERALGRLAGLGWIGKNSMLLSRRFGSFFFIGSLIVDVALEYDQSGNEYCGTCTRCIDACPTGAIIANKIIDAGKCISYLTIENKDPDIPGELSGNFQNRVFGCDICQDVCPWNHNAPLHVEPGLKENVELLSLDKDAWHDMNEDLYEKLFEGSAVKRAGYNGLKRNLGFINN